jgi:hypothetical protein
MLERVVGRMMGAEFGVEITDNSDPDGFGHKGHSKLVVGSWH